MLLSMPRWSKNLRITRRLKKGVWLTTFSTCSRALRTLCPKYSCASRTSCVTCFSRLRASCFTWFVSRVLSWLVPYVPSCLWALFPYVPLMPHILSTPCSNATFLLFISYVSRSYFSVPDLLVIFLYKHSLPVTLWTPSSINEQYDLFESFETK